MAHALAADVLAIEPQYPLWTDGATKRRWIRLPPGTSIDASDPDHFVFPVGTRLWKEFSFERRVETRLITLGADGAWRFASYVWSADERSAELAPETVEDPEPAARRGPGRVHQPRAAPRSHPRPASDQRQPGEPADPLRKRLAEKCPDVRLVTVKRGRFALELDAEIELVEKEQA